MNTSLLKYGLLTVLLSASNATISSEIETLTDADKIVEAINNLNETLTNTGEGSCPIHGLRALIDVFKETPAPIVFSALTTAILVWIYKIRPRDAKWTSRFDKSQLKIDTIRQIWYFIVDEILGHAGEETAVKKHEKLNGVEYITDATVEVCAPHGAVGCTLGYAGEIMKTHSAVASVAALLAWITAHEGQCLFSSFFKSSK